MSVIGIRQRKENIYSKNMKLLMKKIRLLLIALVAGLAIAATFPMISTNDGEGAIFMDVKGKKFDEVLTQFKGKVVYIDFWASWCGPCIGQMPYSAKLHEKYKDKDVAFLYISFDYTKEAWKRGVEKYKIKGYHWMPDKKQMREIMKRFRVKGIPRYMLVSKKGEILTDDFLRPSSKRVPRYFDKALNLE